jgi:hypothetical protein
MRYGMRRREFVAVLIPTGEHVLRRTRKTRVPRGTKSRNHSIFGRRPH